MLIISYAAFAEKKRLADSSFIVGGAVRDLLLGHPVKDIDVVITGDVTEVARSFASATGSSFIMLDPVHRVIRIAGEGSFIDFTPCNGQSLSEDLSMRDYTMNAIALPMLPPDRMLSLFPQSGKTTYSVRNCIFDPIGGCRDIDRKIIRMVSESNLAADPLRILRAFRFAALLGFTIDPGTLDAASLGAHLLGSVAVERIATEIRMTLSSDHAYDTIAGMDKRGILVKVFPERSAYSHAFQAWTLSALQKTEAFLRNPSPLFGSHPTGAYLFFRESYRRICMKMSALLPSGNDAQGAAERLRMPGRDIAFLESLSASGDAFNAMERMDEPDVLTTLGKIGDMIYPLIIRLAAETPEISFPDPLSARVADLYGGIVLPRMRLLPLITGDDLIERFHLSPSPLIGRILKAVDNSVIRGEIRNRDEAFACATRLIAETGG